MPDRPLSADDLYLAELADAVGLEIVEVHEADSESEFHQGGFDFSGEADGPA